MSAPLFRFRNRKLTLNLDQIQDRATEGGDLYCQHCALRLGLDRKCKFTFAIKPSLNLHRSGAEKDRMSSSRTFSLLGPLRLSNEADYHTTSLSNSDSFSYILKCTKRLDTLSTAMPMAPRSTSRLMTLSPFWIRTIGRGAELSLL